MARSPKRQLAAPGNGPIYYSWRPGGWLPHLFPETRAQSGRLARQYRDGRRAGDRPDAILGRDASRAARGGGKNPEIVLKLLGTPRLAFIYLFLLFHGAMNLRPKDVSASKVSISHLRRLEAESIHIMREVVAEFAHPVMLYSIGKDSSVMLHLAMKAFYPAKPPFPLMHVDTT